MPDRPTESSDSPLSDVKPHSKKVGLIGVGLMGIVIAEKLAKSGFEILGWDLDTRREVGLHSVGGQFATSPSDIFGHCSRIILSLPSHETVTEVLDAVQAQLQAGQVIIDTSTGDPSAAALQAKALADRHIGYLDATVSGSSEQLRNGSAVLLIGAKTDSFQACEDLFQALATKIFHTGEPGSGAKMKLVTNLVLGLNRAALAEGLAFANQLGLNLEQTLFLMKESMAYSRIMDTKGEKMLRRDYSPQAKLSQHLKDVRLIEAAAGSELRLPLTAAHRTLLESAEALGLGGLDNSAILEAIEAGRRDKGHA